MDFYRKHILQRSAPDLTDVIQTLAQLGRKERNLPLEALPTDEELAKLRGNINRNEPIYGLECNCVGPPGLCFSV